MFSNLFSPQSLSSLNIQVSRELAGKLGSSIHSTDKPKKSDGRELLNTIPDLHAQVADDYMTARKTKKAGALTKTSLAMIEKQAALANITTAQAIAFAAGKGWVGFMASWYEKEISGEYGKTHAERTQDYKDKQAAEFYAPLLDMTAEERKAWGL